MSVIKFSFALLCLFVVAKSTFAAGRPNVVFMLSDNQSYYELSCHGHAEIKTPHIDAFARESVEFTRFYAPPFCSPSRAVIMTGRFAMRSGVHNTIGGRSILHRSESTIADRMRAVGYETGIFGKWHLGFSYPHRPQDRGFDEVFVHGGGGIGQMEDYFGNTHYSPTFIHNGVPEPSNGFSTDTLFDTAIAWINQRDRSQPFFCYVPTPVTHSPHHGPKDLVQQLQAAGVTGDLGLFAQVQNLDSNVGRMLRALDELELSKSTIVIFASDQGMNDRGSPLGGNRISLGHDPAQHVPMFVRVPGCKAKVCKRTVGMIDVFPTLLDLCGIEIPRETDGVSLKPLLLGTDGYPDERTLIIQCPRGRDAKKWKNSSVKTDRWRLVEGEKLYDINADPRQKDDIAQKHPDVVSRLRSEYEQYWHNLPDQKTTLSRHLLGSPHCAEVVLNAMDWYAGGQPWNSGHFKKSTKGRWAVTVERDGKYQFDCHFYPREANLPAKATSAWITIGDIEQETKIDASDTHARFTLDLKQGDYDLETMLNDGESEKGSLFVYVQRLP